MRMMSKASLLLLFTATALLVVTQPVFAQSSLVSTKVTLTHLNIQLTYPSQMLPGQSVTVNVQAQARNIFHLASLTMQVYYVDPTQFNLRQVASTTIAQDLAMSGGTQINKAVQVTIPTDAPRTSLIARVAENVTLTVFIVYNNSSPSIQAAPFTSSSSDDVIAPLTYIMSATPEYVALQSKYETLQSQYQQVQRGLNQSLSQNVKLQQSLQTAQNTIAQSNSMITDLKNQLTISLGIVMLLAIISVSLVIVYFLRARN